MTPIRHKNGTFYDGTAALNTWGLEGDLFWIVVGGGFAFVMALLLCFSALKMSLMASLFIAAVPLTLCLIYIFVFRQGKPAGYDMDCLDYWLNGSGISPNFQRQPKHPLQFSDV